MSNKIYNKAGKEFKNNFLNLVESSQKIVISGHKKPDDDSIASVMAMNYFLKSEFGKQKEILMFYEGDKYKRWEYFNIYKEVEFVEDLAENSKDADLLILLDGQNWNRFSSCNLYQSDNRKIVCIDHHPTDKSNFDLHLCGNTDYTATTEILYWLLFADQAKILKEICEILMMGILGDTGNFKYITPRQVKVFDVSKRLIVEGGIEVEAFLSKYDNIDENQLRIFKELLNNLSFVSIDNWPKFVTTYVSRDFCQKSQYTASEIDLGSSLFSDDLKRFKGLSWGFSVVPIDNKSVISFRSLPGSVSMRDLAQRMKIGGGHDRAAGGRIVDKKPEEAITEIISWMKKNKPLLV